MAVCLCLIHDIPALIHSPHSRLPTLIHVVILPLVYTVASTLVCILVSNLVCAIPPLSVPPCPPPPLHVSPPLFVLSFTLPFVPWPPPFAFLFLTLCWGGGGDGGAYEAPCKMVVEGDEGRWWHGVDEVVVVVELRICQCEVGEGPGGQKPRNRA
jgi:hypothetical protein